MDVSRIGCDAVYFGQKTETQFSFEILVNVYQTTRRQIQERTMCWNKYC